MELDLTFFSYSRDDSDFVSNLAKDLRSAGEKIWLDQLDIAPGSHWDTSIENALNSSDKVIIVLSKTSVASKNVMDEVMYAIEKNKIVIPLLLEECDVPFRLSRLQHVDFTQDYKGGLNRLISVLGLEHKAVQPASILMNESINNSIASSVNKESWLHKNFKPILLLLGIAAIVLLGIFVISNSQSQKENSDLSNNDLLVVDSSAIDNLGETGIPDIKDSVPDRSSGDFENPVQVPPRGRSRIPLSPTCSDGIKNQGEIGIDCGGPCKSCYPIFTIMDTKLGGKSKLYTIKQKSSNKFLDAYKSLKTGEYIAVSREARKITSQQWVLMPLGNSTYTIRQKGSGRYLDTYRTKGEKHAIVTRPYQKSGTQQWIIKHIGNGTYTIEQKGNGRFMDGYDNESRDFAVVTRAANKNDSQKWLLKLTR